MQTRRELLDEFLGLVGDRNDGDARDRAELALNRAMRNVWLAHPWRSLHLPSPVQVTTVANQTSYALPSYFGRIPPKVTHVTNITTGRKIPLVNDQELPTYLPTYGTTLAQSGTPAYAALGAPMGVRVQPSSAGQALEVVSTSASDTDVRVLVEGLNSDGEWDETQVTLTGTTAVALGTWRAPLLNFTKAYPSTITPATELTSSRGTVTLQLAGGGTALQVLLPEESAREFPSLILAPAPSTAGEIVTVPCIRAPKRLLYDADEIPLNWGSALIEDMLRTWNVREGSAPLPGMLPRPELATLIGHDNSLGGRIRTKPFTGV